MKWMMELFSYVLLGVFAQNVLLCGGIGVDAAIRLAERPKRMFATAGLISLFSILTLLDRLVIDALERIFPALEMFSAALLIFLQAVLCILLLVILGKINHQKTLVLRGLIPGAAFSNIVVIIGMANHLVSMSVPKLIGFSIGTGIAFILVSLLVREAIGRIGNPDMNRAFLGLPSLLIYIGILAMAFVGFTGAPMLFV